MFFAAGAVPLPGLGGVPVTLRDLALTLGAVGMAAGAANLHFMAVSPEAKAKGWAMIGGSALAMIVAILLPDLWNLWVGVSGIHKMPPISSKPVTPFKPVEQDASGGVWGLIVGILSGIVNTVFGGIVYGIFKLISALMQATVFSPVLLTGSGPLAGVHKMYEIVAPVGLVILAATVALQLARNSAGLGSVPTPAILSRSLVSAALIAGGYELVGMLLAANNSLVRFFMAEQHFASPLSFVANPNAILGSLVTGVGAFTGVIVLLFGNLLDLVVLAFAAWIIITYVGRLFEIALWTVSLPLVAAFVPLDSAVWATWGAEIAGAIFVQAVQVFLFWMATYLIYSSSGGLLGGLLQFLMGGMGLYFIARAGSLLRQFTRHRLSGGQVAGEVLAATAIGSAVGKRFQASPMGQALAGRRKQHEADSQEKLADWAGDGGTWRKNPILAGVGTVGGAAGGAWEALMGREDEKAQGLWGSIKMGAKKGVQDPFGFGHTYAGGTAAEARFRARHDLVQNTRMQADPDLMGLHQRSRGAGAETEYMERRRNPAQEARIDFLQGVKKVGGKSGEANAIINDRGSREGYLKSRAAMEAVSKQAYPVPDDPYQAMHMAGEDYPEDVMNQVLRDQAIFDSFGGKDDQEPWFRVYGTGPYNGPREEEPSNTFDADSSRVYEQPGSGPNDPTPKFPYDWANTQRGARGSYGVSGSGEGGPSQDNDEEQGMGL